jgi:hypothetical protein
MRNAVLHRRRLLLRALSLAALAAVCVSLAELAAPDSQFVGVPAAFVAYLGLRALVRRRAGVGSSATAEGRQLSVVWYAPIAAVCTFVFFGGFGAYAGLEPGWRALGLAGVLALDEVPSAGARRRVSGGAG